MSSTEIDKDQVKCTCCGLISMLREPMGCNCWKQRQAVCKTCGKCVDHCKCQRLERDWRGDGYTKKREKR